jgi:hypothetical protein
VEGERRRLIHASLTKSLRAFAGTDFAQAAWSRTLPPELSRSALLAELSGIRARLPESALRERMFGAPDFLKKTAARTREWEMSRSALVEAFRGLEGPEFSPTFTHTDGVALAIVVSGTTAGFGVDLERSDRKISNAAFARFFRSEEGAFLKVPLDHWVLKEACFKAHPRSAETIVADYVVMGVSPAGEFDVLCAKGAPERFRGVIGSVKEYRYAIATQA